LKDGGQLVLQATGDVLFAPEPGVGQDIGGAEARPERAPEHVPEQAVFGLLAGPAHIPGGRTALVLEGFVLGLVDAALLPHDDLGLQRQEALSGGQAQVQHLVSFPRPALGMVEIATGAFDLASGARLAGVVDDEGATGSAAPAHWPDKPAGHLAVKPRQWMSSRPRKS
jgi:hypothetical protein